MCDRDRTSILRASVGSTRASVDSAAYNPDVGATGPSVREDTPRSACPPPSPFGPSPFINAEAQELASRRSRDPRLSRWPVSAVASASIVRINPSELPRLRTFGLYRSGDGFLLFATGYSRSVPALIVIGREGSPGDRLRDGCRHDRLPRVDVLQKRLDHVRVEVGARQRVDVLAARDPRARPCGTGGRSAERPRCRPRRRSAPPAGSASPSGRVGSRSRPTSHGDSTGCPAPGAGRRSARASPWRTPGAGG